MESLQHSRQSGVETVASMILFLAARRLRLMNLSGVDGVNQKEMIVPGLYFKWGEIMIRIGGNSCYTSNPPKRQELERMSVKELFTMAIWKRRRSHSFKECLIGYILSTWRKAE